MKNGRPYTGDYKMHRNRIVRVNQRHRQSASFRSKTFDRTSIIKNIGTDIDQGHQPTQFQITPRPTFKYNKPRNSFSSKGSPFDSQKPNVRKFQQNQSKQIKKQAYICNRSQDRIISRPRMYKIYNKTFKGIEQCIDPSEEEQKYIEKLKSLGELFEIMNNIYLSMQNTEIERTEVVIAQYRDFIASQELKFIDNFIFTLNDRKISQTARKCRIHQCLSVCYLFLEIAQGRFKQNQSYLVNFIGFCASSIRLLTKLFILLEKRNGFKSNCLEQQTEQWQLENFGHYLRKIEFVILRIQHNNQILSMIHKKLGRSNTRFQNYISKFMKIAERKNHSTCLCSHYIFQYLAMYIHQQSETLLGVSKCLQIAPTPYLAPSSKEYTLVFEPIGIIKTIKKQSILLRPYVMQFMKWATKHFDVILWTWEMPSQIYNLEQLFEPYLFSKLYRYHCQYEGEVYTKNLHRLGRDIEKTMIIDYDERIYCKTPHNGFVARWNNKKNDQGLRVICEILEQMINNQSTVQQTLSCYIDEISSIRG